VRAPSSSAYAPELSLVVTNTPFGTPDRPTTVMCAALSMPTLPEPPITPMYADRLTSCANITSYRPGPNRCADTAWKPRASDPSALTTA
jgi:hypothetical protein